MLKILNFYVILKKPARKHFMNNRIPTKTFGEIISLVPLEYDSMDSKKEAQSRLGNLNTVMFMSENGIMNPLIGLSKFCAYINWLNTQCIPIPIFKNETYRLKTLKYAIESFP